LHIRRPTTIFVAMPGCIHRVRERIGLAAAILGGFVFAQISLQRSLMSFMVGCKNLGESHHDGDTLSLGLPSLFLQSLCLPVSGLDSSWLTNGRQTTYLYSKLLAAIPRDVIVVVLLVLVLIQLPTV